MLWMCSLCQFSHRWSSSIGMVRCTTFRWYFKGMLALLHLCPSSFPVKWVPIWWRMRPAASHHPAGEDEHCLSLDASTSLPGRRWTRWQVIRELCRETCQKVVLVQAPDEPPAAAESCEGKGCERESWWRGELPELEKQAGKCQLLRQGGKPRAGSSPASCCAVRGKVNRAGGGIRGWTSWTPTRWSYTNN